MLRKVGERIRDQSVDADLLGSEVLAQVRKLRGQRGMGLDGTGRERGGDRAGLRAGANLNPAEVWIVEADGEPLGCALEDLRRLGRIDAVEGAAGVRGSGVGCRRYGTGRC